MFRLLWSVAVLSLVVGDLSLFVSAASGSASSPLKEVVCPNKAQTCPDNNTCCLQTLPATYGCCPLPKAECCPDQQHCCPHGSRCDAPTGSCILILDDGTKTVEPWTEFVPVPLPPSPPTYVRCPDHSLCADNDTCCIEESGSYGCCLLPNAVCCQDRQYCCPQGTTCGTGKCTKDGKSFPAFKTLAASGKKTPGGAQQQVKKPATDSKKPPVGVKSKIPPKAAPKVTPKAKSKIQLKQQVTPKVDKNLVLCPDKKSTCFAGSTCCVLTTGAWGCCPLPQATCCHDHLHCCPVNSTCDVAQKHCERAQGPAIPWFTKLPSRPLVGGDIICPGGKFSCPLRSTCCKLHSGLWGCCPLPNAVCCADGKHCCPNNYKCNAEQGTCLKSDNSLSVFWQEVADLRGKVSFEIATVCPGSKYKCGKSHKCCSFLAPDGSTKFGCCPFPSGICCGDNKHCCPHDYECDIKHLKCVKEGAVSIPIGVNKESLPTDPNWKPKLKRKKTVMARIKDTFGKIRQALKNHLLENDEGDDDIPEPKSKSKSKSKNPKSKGAKPAKNKVTPKAKAKAKLPVAKEKPATKKAASKPQAKVGKTATPPRKSVPSKAPKVQPKAKIATAKATAKLKVAKAKIKAVPKVIPGKAKAAKAKTVVVPKVKAKVVPKVMTPKAKVKPSPSKLVQKQPPPKPSKKVVSKQVVKTKISLKTKVVAKPKVIAKSKFSPKSKVPVRSKALPQSNVLLKTKPKPLLPKYKDSGGVKPKIQPKAKVFPKVKIAPKTRIKTAAKTPKAKVVKSKLTPFPKKVLSKPKTLPVKAKIDKSKRTPEKPISIVPKKAAVVPKKKVSPKPPKVIPKKFPNVKVKVVSKKPVPKLLPKAKPKANIVAKQLPKPKIVVKAKPKQISPKAKISPQAKVSAKAKVTAKVKQHPGSRRLLAVLPLPKMWSDVSIEKGGDLTLSSSSSEKDEYKTEAPLKRQPLAAIFHNDIKCHNGKTCPDQTTCCEEPSGGYACCPWPNAVCCEDKIHCCQEGQTCDVEGGECKTSLGASAPWGVKFPSHSHVNYVEDRYVLCPDGASTCPDGSTCCLLDEEHYGCCPLFKATCCEDRLHCCPAGFHCEPGHCVKEWESVPWVEKVPALTAPSGDLGVIKCSDGEECPDGTTCCKMKTGKFGCCPNPKATCCDDEIHCCPSGYTCDEETGACNKPQATAPLKTISDALSTLSVGNEVSDQCTEHSCQKGMTCCVQKDAKVGCCPHPEAVCCSDGQHCCPKDFQCDSKSTKCIRSETNIPWVPNQRAMSVNDVRRPEHHMLCPDKESACPSDSTCCEVNDNQWACCPLPKATCCSDRKHCCPEGYMCSVKKGQCTKRTAESSTISNALPLLTRSLNQGNILL